MRIFNEKMQENSRNNFKSGETEISSFNAAFNLESSKSFAGGFKYPDDTEDESEEQIEETVMPVEFYQNFDTFLNNCPPKLKIGQSLSSTEKSSHASPKVSIKSTTEKKKKPTASDADKASFSASAPTAGKVIDDDLLREAFAYTAKNDGQDSRKEEVKRSSGGKLAKAGSTQFSFDREGKTSEGVSERSRDSNSNSNGNGDRGSWRCQSEPFSSSHIDMPSKGSTSGSDGTGQGTRRVSGVVQKLRSKTLSNSSDSASSDFKRGDSMTDVGRGHCLAGGKDRGRDGDGAVFAVSSVSCEEDRNSRKNKKADLHSLVTNFEKGLTLKRLQMELSESKESLDKSREAIQNISDSFKRDIG